jgi:glycosyltransferase involved in cell wall biosynthesis
MKMAIQNRSVIVSVLIPTYNRGHILGQALQSVLNQTYQDFEILVVDDGSSDDTVDVLKSFPDERIRYFRHPQNRGCSAAYNTGISLAEGTFVATLDSDDSWMPNYLERQVGFLTRHPEIGAAFSDLEIVADTHTIPSLTGLMRAFPKLWQRQPSAEEFAFNQSEMYVCLLEEIPIKPSACVVRRTVFGEVGVFNEAWPSGTDWDLFLRMSRAFSFGYINLPLVSMKWSADATHRKYWEKDKLFLIGLFTKEKRDSGGGPEIVDAINRGLLKHYSDLALFYLISGRRGKSVSIYLAAFKETGNVSMLLRALAALMPLGLRELSKKSFRKVIAPKSGPKELIKEN